MDILQDRFGDHGNNELLNEREEVAVGVAHNLVELPLLVVVETGELVHTAQWIGQETLGEIEVLAGEDLVLLPRHLLGGGETSLIRVGV
jgi:hypothetical protein